MAFSRQVSSSLQQNCGPDVLGPHFCWPLTLKRPVVLTNEKHVAIALVKDMKGFSPAQTKWLHEMLRAKSSRYCKSVAVPCALSLGLSASYLGQPPANKK